MNESVLSSKEEQHSISYFQIAHKYHTLFYDWPVNYYSWKFRYMITRLSILWPWTTDEYVIFWFLV